MPERERGPEFLKEKFDLHTSDEIDRAAKRREQRTNEKVGPMPDEKIENYLNRLESIINPPIREGARIDRRERNIGLLRQALYDQFVIEPEDIPDSYWQNQRQLIRERGQQADLDQADWQELQRQNTEAIIADQKSTLDNWLDYLTSEDATYPDWLKYYAFRSILSMGSYDKEKKEFSKRSKGTTAPFPDLNREALAYVLDAIEKRQGEQYQQREHQIRGLKNKIRRLKGVRRSGGEVGEDLKETQEALNQAVDKQVNLVTKEEEQDGTQGEQAKELVDRGDFANLYAWAIEKVTPASVEQIKITDGKWVKYEQGSDHMSLVESIQGHGTGWCTAGESTAKAQLETGDFYVYYSQDQEGEDTIPRVAIRMEGSGIGEVRGIAEEQNLDPYIGPIVEEKLDQFPDGDKYRKKVADMEQLTNIEKRTNNHHQLTAEELKFLYEIDSQIEGFGYQRDPRIEEIKSRRDPKEDAPIVLGLKPAEIAWNQEEIDESTKAYVGPLFPGIFDQLSDLEYIYTSFPEAPIRRGSVEIGGKTAQELEKELKDNGINISDNAQDMLNSPDFNPQAKKEEINTVRLKVFDLGLTSISTTEQIFVRAQELGLELCPAEVGPHQRLIDIDQPLNDWYSIAMEPIADRDGFFLGVFRLYHGAAGLWLYDSWAIPEYRWRPESSFLFRFRKSS